MSGKTGFSIAARIRSFRYAFRGLAFLIQSQHNARIHLVLTCVVVTVGYLLRISITDWCLLIVAMSSVWVAEALNTAIECLTDLVSPDIHPLAGRAKDVAAGAVLISAIAAATVGVLVFAPHLLKLI